MFAISWLHVATVIQNLLLPSSIAFPLTVILVIWCWKSCGWAANHHWLEPVLNRSFVVPEMKPDGHFTNSYDPRKKIKNLKFSQFFCFYSCFYILPVYTLGVSFPEMVFQTAVDVSTSLKWLQVGQESTTMATVSPPLHKFCPGNRA